MEDKKKNVHEITIKFEGSEWTEALDKSFKKNNQKAKIDGFRPGKAPRNVYEKKYGKESLYMDAVDFILENQYAKVIKDSKLEPVIQPSVDIKNIDDNGVELIFVITTKPEVKLGKYKDLGVKKEKVSVTEEEAMNRIGDLQKQYAEVTVKDGKIENGDTAIIDFDGYLNDVPFEGGKSENYPLEIGSNTFIPGFEEQLIGLSSNDEKDIKVTFPKDYPSEDLKGKDVIFKIKVHEVKSKKLPELDKEFFLDLGMEDIKTKEDLVKKIKEEIKHEKEHQADDKYIDELLEKASSNMEVDIPKEFVDAEVERMFSQFEQNIKMQGIDAEQYCKFLNTDITTIKNQMRTEAEKRVKYRMLLEEITVLESIEANDEEADKEADDLALKYQMTKEELLKAFGGLEMIKYDIQMKKAINVLKGE